MMSSRTLHVIIVSLLMLWSSVGAAQTSAPTKPLEDALSPQAEAARKAEVQKEIKTLQESKLPEDQFQRFQADKKLSAAKDALGALLTALTGLEKARQRRSSFLKSVEDLPRRLEELQAERRRLETRGPRLFPIELWGLERFEDTGLIIRARLNTKPIEQWRIGREFNRRMKQAFEAEGIQMAVTHRMLFLRTPPNRQDSQSTVMEDYPPSMGKREVGAERGKT